MTQVNPQNLPNAECRRRGLDIDIEVDVSGNKGRVVGYDRVGDPIVQFVIGGPVAVYATDAVAKQPQAASPYRETVEAREAVNHPSHYGGADNLYEAIKVIEAWDLGFCLGNTVKYISRAGKKYGAEELVDLRKARWYLDREITRREAEKRATSATTGTTEQEAKT